MCSTELSPMKQLLKDCGKPFLPEDIIRNILIRLPVKSLIRFQSVCKSWKCLIELPSFIADHLHHSDRQNPQIIYQGDSLFEPSGWCFFDKEMQVVKAQSTPTVGSLSSVTILSSIDGLLCFNSRDASIFLWNPATREVKQVFQGVNTADDSFFLTGFGFSADVNDYKLVRIHVTTVDLIILYEECSLCANRVDQAFLYSLSTGSCKEIEFGNLDGVSLMSQSLYVNGAIFWFGFMLSEGEDDENDGHLVISFDLATEVFTLIPIPSSAPKSHRNVLTVHENNLAMLCHTAVGELEFSMIELWVMEEGTDASGKRWNWTKKYSTDPFPFLLHPGTIRGNEIVCKFLRLGAATLGVNAREGRVVLFNITTNEFEMFHIPKYGDGTSSFLNYVESLVSVRNNHIE